jgi:hypothetical protein
MPVNGAATTTSAPATGNAIYKNALNVTFQVIAAAAATVIVEATNELATANGTNNNWVPLATITLAAAGTDGFASSAAWVWVRARVTAATQPTSVLMGC